MSWQENNEWVGIGCAEGIVTYLEIVPPFQLSASWDASSRPFVPMAGQTGLILGRAVHFISHRGLHVVDTNCCTVDSRQF